MRTGMTREELLRFPVRNWDTRSRYKSIIIVPTNDIHETGYRSMAIVGIDSNGQFEVAARNVDDIAWMTNNGANGDMIFSLRFDMDPANDCVHAWCGGDVMFEIGYACSTTEVRLMYERLS